jgi:two-component system, chemotaxis family, CheB/CheR fusion protein
MVAPQVLAGDRLNGLESRGDLSSTLQSRATADGDFRDDAVAIAFQLFAGCTAIATNDSSVACGGPVVAANDKQKGDREAQEQSAEESPPHSPAFPVVGVGASAGGLEAFIELLEGLSPGPGMAILLVLHRGPGHKSLLPEIVQKSTSLPVIEVTEGVPVEVNRIYIIPPGTNMALADGRLALTPREPPPRHNMPADYLFRSLAAIQKSHAVGVILSGGGTDGALGFQAIKAEGGITFAQDESTAKQYSMPRAAILDGCVDYILRPRDIARQLERLARHSYAREVPASADALPAGDAVTEIIILLRVRTNVDFAHYKRTTIKRRILRRMALRGLENPLDYLRLLRDDAAELHNLYQDFLIRVTQFFRDSDAFDALKEQVFPAVVKGRAANSPIRIWVAGCSTGEEVYSLAIVLKEYLEAQAASIPIKILATDLNEQALEKARAGIYLDNIEMDVAPERLRRFFLRGEGHYQIDKSIRELCIFSRQNLVSDPPFSRLDLVSCRNVLIYMDSALQRRVVPILHHALNPDGFLFLGSSEHVGNYNDLFATVDARYRIFLRKAVPSGAVLDFAPHVAAERRFRPVGHEESAPVWSTLDVQKEADRILLARYAPVGVVVDEAMTVLQFRGRTAPYIEPAPGLATLDLLRMLREGLLADARSALAQSRTENTAVVRSGLQLTDGNETRSIELEVIPFRVPPTGVRFFLVLFHDERGPAPGPVASAPAPHSAGGDQHVAQLQLEIGALREYLQSVIEEQESTNEELRSANEEILSANEELQSTNEELQLAKEEAQSANEELATVNEELNHRNAELSRVNNDLLNVLSGVNIPIVMVGRDLRVRRFTPLAEKIFNLIPTDAGRRLSDIKPNLVVADLPQLIVQVINTLTPYEGEVQETGGHWYSLRIRPYVTLDSKIDGASIVLLDIDSIKRLLEKSPPDRDASDGQRS